MNVNFLITIVGGLLIATISGLSAVAWNSLNHRVEKVEVRSEETQVSLIQNTGVDMRQDIEIQRAIQVGERVQIDISEILVLLKSRNELTDNSIPGNDGS